MAYHQCMENIVRLWLPQFLLVELQIFCPSGNNSKHIISLSLVTCLFHFRVCHLCRSYFFLLEFSHFFQATTQINNQCTRAFVGTSASNPMAAGVIALAMEAK